MFKSHTTVCGIHLLHVGLCGGRAAWLVVVGLCVYRVAR